MTTFKLPKYRIIEKAGVYRVQRKWCGVWWTESYTTDPFGIALRKNFRSLEEARTYVRQLQTWHIESKTKWREVQP